MTNKSYTTINTVTYGNTVAKIGASTLAPHFAYECDQDHHIYIDGIEVTDIINKHANSIKQEAIDYEKSKPKPKPKDPVKSILINPIKSATTIVWNDGTVTMVHCNDEEFDAEKGIAMCFMKKAFDNRGCFNDFLKKYMNDKNWTQKPKDTVELRAGESYTFTLEDAKVDFDSLKTTFVPTTKNMSDEKDDVSGFLELTEEDWKEIFGSKEGEDETE